MPLTVAIIGRPNVGKSTLFNRLAGGKKALVASEPGLTRDRRMAQADLGGLDLRIIDTAGVETGSKGDLATRMRAQTEAAVKEADVALFVIDSRAGLTAFDKELGQWLRRQKKPVLLLANKAEAQAGAAGIAEAFGLGLGEPIAISAEHGDGMGDLYAALLPFTESEEEQPEAPAEDEAESETQTENEAAAPDKPLQLAVVGRPNVGKSTLINKLLGEERVLTGPEPGVTRDAIAIDWSWRGKPVRLVDTAGLRRRARVEKGAEKLSTGDTLRTIRFAEVVVLMIDATLGLERQDLTIARLVADEGRAVVLAVNKWDLVKEQKKTLTDIIERLEDSLPQLAGLKPLTLSAATGAGTDKLMPAVQAAYAAWNKRATTGALNRLLERAQEQHPPPLVKGRRLKLRFMTQVNIRPPSFALFASRPGELPEAWRRYLVNRLREAFDLPGVPIRVMLRKGKNPYAE